jgi:tRNA pseudouridine-54 N-methylase
MLLDMCGVFVGGYVIKWVCLVCFGLVCVSRGFVLFSRLGRTDSGFGNLHDAGRLDIVYECVVASLFLSHGLRRDVTFDAFLNGPPSPPLHLSVNGETLYDVRTDIDTWQSIIRKAISGKVHPGIARDRRSFEAFLKEKSESAPIYVLEEDGKDATAMQFPDRAFFVLGDHVGLPKKAESFALRFGEKISVGKRPYLAASCITIMNYLLDHEMSLVK